ncbi:MAG: arginine--tRNA ligase [Clostridia bacterium]
MAYMRDIARTQIGKIIEDAFSKTLGMQGSRLPEITIEVPKEKSHGDFSTNIAMVLAGQARMAPAKIASLLVEGMQIGDSYIESVEWAPPGFINFCMSDQWLYEGLEEVIRQGSSYGSSDMGKGRKVMVEFVSANPTGPLHMGNARGGALGDLIAKVLEKSGYEVTKEFYVNDAGNQIEKFGLSLEARYLQEKLGEDRVEFPADGYQGEDIREHVLEYIRSGQEDLMDKPSEERRRILVDDALPRNIGNMKKTLGRYGIEYDVWFSEKILHESGDVQKAIDYMKEKGHTVEYDGALWLKGPAMGVEKDEVLVRGNQIPTYFAADIAYHWNKFHERGFHRVIDLLGADHHGHVQRMKGAVECIGIDRERIDIVVFQLVRLLRNGEVARMSKRTGKAITLEDLLDEVGVDAARFFFNTKSSGSHLDFDLDLAVRKSNENPVFYVQYAHARICSMLRILNEEGCDLDRHPETIDLTLLSMSQEKDLIRKLCEYPDELTASALTLEPSRLTRYVVDLAGLFHSFYNACRLKGEEEPLLYARLSLVKAVKTVIGNVLEVLSIQAPEKM